MADTFVEEFDEGEEPTTSQRAVNPVATAPHYAPGTRALTDNAPKKTRTNENGEVYEYDENLHAWFPKVDEKVYDAYMNTYGNGESLIEKAEENYRNAQEAAHLKKGKRKAEVVEEVVANTAVYFENVPPDATVDEIADFFGRRCGVVATDHKGQKRVKLYKDGSGASDGTGLCFFHRAESVELAMQLLDGTEMRDGLKVTVSKAEFKEQRTVKRKKGKSSARDEKSKGQDKLLDWTDRETKFKSKRALCTVVIKHMFDPKEFEQDAGMIFDLKEDIRPEFENIGDISKMIVFDRHPEGVVSVTYKEQKHAQKCIKKMNGRLFDGKRLSCATWDGVTKYDVAETDDQCKTRMEQWERDLHQ